MASDQSIKVKSYKLKGSRTNTQLKEQPIMPTPIPAFSSSKSSSPQYSKPTVSINYNTQEDILIKKIQEEMEKSEAAMRAWEREANWLGAFTTASLALQDANLLHDYWSKNNSTMPNGFEKKRQEFATRVATYSQMISKDTVSGGSNSGLPSDNLKRDEEMRNCSMMVEANFKKGSRDCEVSWFSQLAGLDSIKKLLPSLIVDPFIYPSLIEKKPLGILLYGPPGTGKTSIARACANQLMDDYKDKTTGEYLVKIFFYTPDSSSLKSLYYGGTEKIITATFQCAQKATENWEDSNRGKKALSIIFVDELDDLAPKRGGDDKNATISVNTLIRQLQGFTDNSKVIFIGATNFREQLDPAILDLQLKLRLGYLQKRTSNK